MSAPEEKGGLEDSGNAKKTMTLFISEQCIKQVCHSGARVGGYDRSCFFGQTCQPYVNGR